MKELKERFSRCFNKHHERRGTLWMERFKSVLAGDGEALRTMALYIDLNPVRAGLVDGLKDCRWTGYGEATGGSKRALSWIDIRYGEFQLVLVPRLKGNPLERSPASITRSIDALEA